MLISDYRATVGRTDWTRAQPEADRAQILRYGLVGEIGSVVAAVKKQLLAADKVERRRDPAGDVAEELGDVLWYCFALYQVLYPEAQRDLAGAALVLLREEVAGGGERSRRIQRWLGERTTNRFLDAARRYEGRAHLSFTDYQSSAVLTARTRAEELVVVCLSVLTQLGAELLRPLLPPIERELNTTLPNRTDEVVLGEVLWHLSALAWQFGLADANARKLMFRRDRSQHTPLHDDGAPPGQQLPRRFTIHVAPIDQRRSRMYLDGKPLGDDLTDNARDADGYRFHDAMHLANAAHLGWSPVLRALMKRKRKYDPSLDEIEDGARAQIVEEAVVKIVHSEGERVARERGEDGAAPLFADPEEISFSFLKLVRGMVAGLEAERNRDAEWEAAIMAGHGLFHQLKAHRQGTIDVDLDARTISFAPDVPDGLVPASSG